MPLNVVMDKLEDIPEPLREYYSERDGKFHLTGIGGVKTQSDIDRIQEGARKEREDHKETRDKLRRWEVLGDLEEVQTKVDKYPELEVMAQGNKEEFEAKLEDLTEARVRSRLAPVERERDELKSERDKLAESNNGYEAREKKRTIYDQIDAGAAEVKTLPEMQPHIRLWADSIFDLDDSGQAVTKENVYGIPEGLTPDLFFAEMKVRNTPWWPNSVGGGATGADGEGTFAQNPWSAAHWNLTKQGDVIRDKGLEKAEQMAAAAGSAIGAIAPPVSKK